MIEDNLSERIDRNSEEPRRSETDPTDDGKFRKGLNRFGMVARSDISDSVSEDDGGHGGDRHLEKERELDDRIQQAAIREASLLRANAVNAEPAVTRDLDEAARRVGSKLDGLEHKLKTESSLREKLTKFPLVGRQRDEPEKVIAKRGSGVNDILRYTVISTEERYMTSRSEFHGRIEADGYTIQSFRNSWVSPDGTVAEPYRGINETWRSPEGYSFEIQFHTSASYAMKDFNHKLYEEWRKPETLTPRAQEVAGIMSGRFDGIPVPPGALPGSASTE